MRGAGVRGRHWRAQFASGGKISHLGTFGTKEEAAVSAVLGLSERRLTSASPAWNAFAWLGGALELSQLTGMLSFQRAWDLAAVAARGPRAHTNFNISNYIDVDSGLAKSVSPLSAHQIKWHKVGLS